MSADDGWRAYAVSARDDPSLIEAAAKTAASLGFNTLLALGANPAEPAPGGGAVGGVLTDAALSRLVAAARSNGLRASVAIVLDRISADHVLAVQISPRAFQSAADGALLVVDPRRPIAPVSGNLLLKRPGDDALRHWWTQRLDQLSALGFTDFVQINPESAGRRLAEALARVPGRPIRDLQSNEALQSAGKSAPFVTAGFSRDANALPDRLAHVALTSNDWAFEAFPLKVDEAIRSVNRLLCDAQGEGLPLVRNWTGPAAPLSVLSRITRFGAVIAVQNQGSEPATWPPKDLPPLPWRRFAPLAGFEFDQAIAPGQSVLMNALAVPAAKPLHQHQEPAIDPALRVVIGSVSPSVGDGAFAVKRVIGERLEVRADIFTDGHEKLAAAVLARPVGADNWTRTSMRAESNDVWTASVAFDRLGSHEFMIEAWLDIWGGFVRDLVKKRDAGRDVSLDIREGRALLEAAAERVPDAQIVAAIEALRQPDLSAPPAVLLSDPLAAVMAAADERRFLAHSFVQPVEVEREAARFSSWYELFPRSQTDDKSRHGTFTDIIARLPQVSAMGFDTLYFPPIHPIGTTNRKGPNNNLTAAPGDVGSPYAIGSAEGGHTAIHRELGTLDDFRVLIAAAKRQGLEIALDFAIQCSPDHPWLREHRQWFAWRADGSLKYAENPPKTYEDIVNVDFYGPEAPTLWLALRDVVLFWLGEGVKTFRVDNPHTKPLPFWRWLISEVKAADPEAVFLSEAFTRPKPMYHLAKVGFSQSYSYFTWRHTKAEFQDYLTELTQTGVREFFRPNFFVNTPDINPYFLQTSGRGGFLIRAALAATLSGLFGVYAGFELCESAPLAGREEYLDSEKYEIRPRPTRAAGDIVDEITALNRLRRAEPALQTHLNLTFHNASNDQILYFSKTAPGRDDRILAAISLDPHGEQQADFEVPLWLFGLDDSAEIDVEDLLSGRRFRWTGKIQHLRLTPTNPYAIWRIQSGKGR